MPRKVKIVTDKAPATRERISTRQTTKGLKVEQKSNETFSTDSLQSVSMSVSDSLSCDDSLLSSMSVSFGDSLSCEDSMSSVFKQESGDWSCASSDGTGTGKLIRFQKRRKLRPNETAEERMERLVRERLLRQIKETPEQRQERLLKARLARLSETPEQRIERLNKKKMYRLAETEAERQERLEKERLFRSSLSEEKRQEYLLKKKQRRLSETPEERAQRLTQDKLRRLTEPPEKREERLLKARLARQNETPEEREERLRRRKMYRLAETDEQRTARLMMEKNLRMARSAELNLMKKLKRRSETAEQRQERLIRDRIMRMNEPLEKREERLYKARFIRENETAQQRQERLAKKKLVYLAKLSSKQPKNLTEEKQMLVKAAAEELARRRAAKTMTNVAIRTAKRSLVIVRNSETIELNSSRNDNSSVSGKTSVCSDFELDSQQALFLDCSEEAVEDFEALPSPSDTDIFPDKADSVNSNLYASPPDPDDRIQNVLEFSEQSSQVIASTCTADRSDESSRTIDLCDVIARQPNNILRAEMRLVLPSSSEDDSTAVSVGSVEIVGFLLRSTSSSSTEYVCARCLTPACGTLVEHDGNSKTVIRGTT